MTKYDGLIIPRGYNDYISKTDAATLINALQLSGVMDSMPIKDSGHPVKSGGVWNALQLSGVMDSMPIKDSGHPVKSGGVWNALQNGLLLHNIPRAVPKDITAYITDGSLWHRLAGTGGYSLHEDIFVGDYIKMSRPISAYERTQTYQMTGSQYVTVAGISTLKGNGDTISMDYEHLVMIAGQGFGGTQHFGRSRMNSTNTTVGGYKSSEMNTTTIGAVATAGSTATTATINEQLYAEFGTHLKTTRELVSNSINATGTNRFGSATGCANSWEWISAQAIMLSEVECYGSTVFSSSGYDTGNANKQLPLFLHSNKARNNRTAYYWLKDTASAAYFCYADDSGTCGCRGAGGAYVYVRPRFVIA